MHVTVVPKCVSFAGMAGKVIGFMLKSWSPRMMVLVRSSESLEFTLPLFAQRKSHGGREFRWLKILTGCTVDCQMDFYIFAYTDLLTRWLSFIKKYTFTECLLCAVTVINIVLTIISF